MEQLVVDMMAERRRSGREPGAVFWVALAWDTVIHALQERVRPSAPRREERSTRRRGRMLNGTLSDLRYAVRSIARQPLYAVLTVVMMTLAIAGNAAVFRIFNGLFLRPLPFAAADRLVALDETAPQWNLEYTGIAYPDLVAWRRDNRSFTGMGAYSKSSADLSADGQAVHVGVLRATHDLTAVLGLEPVAGRAFTAQDDVANGPRVALLTHGFWQSQFGGRPEVVGTTIRLSTETFEVIGVLPPAAGFLADAGVWLPLQEEVSDDSGWYLDGIARLAPGASLESAREDLLRVHRGLVPERDVNAITSPVVSPLRDRYLGDVRLGSSVLLGSVAIVLLIACANIAGLMLARALVRGREMGIRVALGATSYRIVRQLLTESLVLAAAGTALGALIGSWISSLLVSRMSAQFPRWVTFELDWRFIAFTAAVTVGAALVSGLAPALQSAGVDVSKLLHGTSSRTSASGTRRRSMRALVVAEVALALVLLIGAGLGVRDFRQLLRVDPGFRTGNVLSYTLKTPRARYGAIPERVVFWNAHLERIRALPGVLSAATASSLPLSGHWGWFFAVEGAPPRAPDEPNPVVLNRVVSPGYLETMGVQLVAGRDFNEFDGRTEGGRAVLVDEAFVRQFFPGTDDVLGRRIHTGGDSPWMTIVGIARDVRHYGVDEATRPGVYQPMGQLLPEQMQVAVRTAADPMSVVDGVRAALREQDPDVAPYEVVTMAQRYDDALWTRRASAWLITVFSTIALVMAVAGLYGVISYGVTQRIPEISIRMALGARRSQVLRRILGEAVLLTCSGIGLGLVAAAFAARALSGVLVGIRATDPLTWIGVTTLLLGVALLANLLPARRAASLHPMRALKGE